MEGFDLDWNLVGNRRYATYTALPSGSYLFRVKACNNDGIWNEKGVSLRVRVIPPWWGRREFKFLILLTVLFLLLILYRVRTFSIRERARELELRIGQRTRALRTTNVRLEREVTEHRRTERALRESEDKYRSLAAQIPVGVYRTTQDGRYLYANPALAAMLGTKSVEDLMKTSAASAFADPADRDRLIALWKTKSGAVSSELRFKTRQGRLLLVRVRGTVIPDLKGGIEYISGIIEDITGQKRAEEKLKTALREKEFLLKEIHHRVKNNLQVISSLLRLQSRSTESGPARELLLASQGRIRLRLRLGRIPLNINQAIPCGLIINELVSNALKHAFPGDRAGRILIALSAGRDGTVRLTVRDNGVGFPPGFDYRKTNSLGMQIVIGLAGQLGGTMTPGSKAGAEVVIAFPLGSGSRPGRGRR
jgi:PAS domain S-box-containing protein